METIGAADELVRKVVEALRSGEVALGKFDKAWGTVAGAADGFARSARQARVLAINASIEAAAFDGGGGFRIVAERMRALSATTQETARDVEGIAQRSRTAVATTLASTSRTRAALEAIDVTLTRVGADRELHGAVVAEVLASIEQARGYGDEVDTGAQEMLAATDQIEALVNRVADVAADAQLLAINAAIEAARAGERGLGFTVIADGIAALAHETGASSEKLVQTVVALRDRTQRLRAGSAQQGATMGEIVTLLERLTT